MCIDLFTSRTLQNWKMSGSTDPTIWLKEMMRWGFGEVFYLLVFNRHEISMAFSVYKL
jgi:hypothetical protein